MHSRMLKASNINDLIFSKSVFKCTEREHSDSDSNDKIQFKSASGGRDRFDTHSMLEPNENMNFDTKS